MAAEIDRLSPFIGEWRVETSLGDVPARTTFEWTLERETPDFTPLGFSQRYRGEFSADGTRIDGRWETTEPGGSAYALDFELSYVRA